MKPYTSIIEERPLEIEESIDSTPLMSIPKYFRILKQLGFKIVYDESFHGDNAKERFYILFDEKRSILLRFDTYTYPDGEVVIGASKMYYNWICNQAEKIGSVPGMKEFREVDGEFVWAAECDAASNIIQKILALELYGDFIDWKVAPRISLLNYAEDINDIRRSNQYKINRLPEAVLNKIIV